MSKDVGSVLFLPYGASRAAGKGASKAATATGILPKKPDLTPLKNELSNQKSLADAQQAQLSDAIRARRAMATRGSSQALLFSGLLGTRQTLGG